MRADEFISEKWSEKYKRSINCANPKGFSQRAHCAGRKKKTNEDTKPRLVRIHRFRVHPQDADLAQQAGLQQDRYGNWILLQYDTSGATFNRRFSQAVRMFGQPQSEAVNETAMTEFAVNDNDDGQEPDEFEMLRRLSAQWYHGDEDPRAEKTLAAMGWEIGHIESGDPKDAVFVIRSGDEHGKSYIGFSVDDLDNLNEQLYFKGSPCTVDCSGHRAGYEWWFRKGRTPNSWSQSFNNGAALAAAGK